MESLSGALFPASWWVPFDLGGYRPCSGAYALYPYGSLPPLPEPDESLSWLAPLSDAVDSEMAVHRRAPEERGALDAIAAEARKLASLCRYPSPVSWRLPCCKVASPPAPPAISSWAPTSFPVPAPTAPTSSPSHVTSRIACSGTAISCPLMPSGGHHVLAFPGDMATYIGEAIAGQQVTMEDIAGAIRVCAPSFASFIYRFWLEDTIWFKLNSSDAPPFTASERAYLDYYTQQRASQN